MALDDASGTPGRTPAALVEVEHLEEGIHVLTLNRPAQRNALSSALAEALTEAVQTAGETARCVVITGRGPAFCAGADLKERATLTKAASRAHNRRLFGAFEAVARCPVPVVCAMHGAALGGGLELALAADIRIADATTRLGLPEVGLGIIPGAGGTQRLGRIVGSAWARALLLTGRTLDADEARRIHLVHEVVPAGEDRERAIAWAQEIARKAPLAVRAVKEILRVREEDPLGEGFALEREMLFRLFQTEDRDEGLRAFVEKRPPRFHGT